MQNLHKFNFKINVILNGSEKHMNFTLNRKLIFIDSFQFLSSSLDKLVENLELKISLSIWVEYFILDRVHQKFIPMSIWVILKIFKENCLAKTKTKLELITDPYIPENIRSLYSYISSKYSKANKEHLNSYIQKQESKHVMYLDTKN